MARRSSSSGGHSPAWAASNRNCRPSRPSVGCTPRSPPGPRRSCEAHGSGDLPVTLPTVLLVTHGGAPDVGRLTDLGFRAIVLEATGTDEFGDPALDRRLRELVATERVDLVHLDHLCAAAPPSLVE